VAVVWEVVAEVELVETQQRRGGCAQEARGVQ